MGLENAHVIFFEGLKNSCVTKILLFTVVVLKTEIYFLKKR